MPMMTGRPEPMRWKMGKSWSRVARAVRIRETWIIRVLSALQTAGVRNQDGRGNDADYGGDHVLESQREKLSGLRDAAPLENGILAGGVGVTHSNRLTKIF